MIIIEGFLLTPPDRGSIIGRTAWKPRYIVLGSSHFDSNMQNNSPSTPDKASKTRIGLKSTSKSELSDSSYLNEGRTEIYLSIFKAKGEWEHIAQYPTSEIQSCEIRTLQYRKQSPAISTLAIEFKKDSLTSKYRKRRSNRTSISLKDRCLNTLLFRSVEGEHPSIYDWVMQIKLLLMSSTDQGESKANSVINFTNPFASTSKPGSSRKLESRGTVSSQSWSLNPYAHSEKFTDLVSSTPSLRSKRSDLSSQSSSLAKLSGLTSSLVYGGRVSSEFPSPSSTNGNDYHMIEGRASTQGRTSALSSYTRESNGISPVINPPCPRETILDRAFQMRYIPEGDMVNSTEDLDKLSSTARFEALMREHDEKKQSSNDTDSNKEISCDFKEKEINFDDMDNSEDDLYISDHGSELPMTTQTTLDFSPGQGTPIKQALSPPPKSPTPFANPQALSALSGHGLSLDNYCGTRQRTDALSNKNQNRPAVLNFPIISFPPSNQLFTKEISNNLSNMKLDAKTKRRSSTSAKRISFQEFARRLSSTSSLLLVQTNVSSNSGRASGDSISDFIASNRSCLIKEEIDQRCAWRGSVGAFGVEGTFL